MKQIYIILILKIIFSNISFSQNIFKKTYVFSINKSLPRYSFEVTDITPGNDSGYIDKIFNINIYKDDGKVLIQSIRDTIHEVWMTLGFLSEGNLLDINFDDYKDLVLVSGIGAMGKNWSFDVFLFNKKDKKFHKEIDFCDFCNITLNNKLKTINEHIDEGCASECYTENTYKIMNNKPFIIQSINQDSDLKTAKFRRYISKYKNGELISKKEIEPQIF